MTRRVRTIPHNIMKEPVGLKACMRRTPVKEEEEARTAVSLFVWRKSLPLMHWAFSGSHQHNVRNGHRKKRRRYGDPCEEPADDAQDPRTAPPPVFRGGPPFTASHPGRSHQRGSRRAGLTGEPAADTTVLISDAPSTPAGFVTPPTAD
ncbi:hypothetical protein AAFF_G00273630 [Aldrovandia affinis]|uniref:Uncharacterized protein n=1 Tax=Aldrovandia affinis TaxID=143900 RepID=A0AAD7SRY8_9TELE|nr:hypothetical protein AAFF_G00273630 [Aldrovandia affinis]